MEARKRVEAAEIEIKHLKGVLAKAKVDLDLEKVRRRAEDLEAMKKLAKAEIQAKKRSAKGGHQAMVEYKTSTDMIEGSSSGGLQDIKKFYNNCIKLNEQAFQKGHKLGQADYYLLVTIQYLELDLSWLEKREESEEKPSPFECEEAAPVSR